MTGCLVITLRDQSMSNHIPLASADVLREDFHQLYGSGHDFEGEKLIEIVVSAGQLLAEIVGGEDVDAAFATDPPARLRGGRRRRLG